MKITASVGIGGVNNAWDVRTVQELLNECGGFPATPSLRVDGVCGPRTVEAIKQAQTFFNITADGLINRGGPTFLKLARLPHQGEGNKNAVVKMIMEECGRQGIGLVRQMAYVLATVEHETNRTFLPVVESYWVKDPDAYNRKHHPDYYPYYGRGLVQLTWEKNYRRFGDLLKIDLVGNPNLALDMKVSVFVLCYGFAHGSFTGKRLQDYVDATKTYYLNARHCINGTDRAAHIADLARAWEEKLNA